MGKRKLVVIGNGMAGARAVEEVLARGGADMFDITMFGDERYGNYNRILLSNILSGIQDTSEIFLNPLDWYAENGITLYAGSPVTEIDRYGKAVQAANGVTAHYDKLLIATGSRALRWPPFVGQFDGLDKLGPGFVRPPTSLPRSPRRPRRGSVRPAHYAGVRHCNSRSTSKARPATPSRSRRHAGKCTRISGCARAAR
jgi:NADPH-dependent 2,4-dienoyl-CoA reductase/sulfur reductase-like enzyme